MISNSFFFFLILPISNDFYYFFQLIPKTFYLQNKQIE
jgi:hypothetical protein